MLLDEINGTIISLPLFYLDFHLFFPLGIFSNRVFVVAISATATETPVCSSWSNLRHVFDRVHKLFYGHSSFAYIMLLLERSGVWSDDVDLYLLSEIRRFNACLTSARPKPSLKVSLASLHRHFNDVVCVDHFFLDGTRIFHAMDSKSRYSAGQICDDLSLAFSISAFE